MACCLTLNSCLSRDAPGNKMGHCRRSIHRAITACFCCCLQQEIGDVPLLQPLLGPGPRQDDNDDGADQPNDLVYALFLVCPVGLAA